MSKVPLKPIKMEDISIFSPLIIKIVKDSFGYLCNRASLLHLNQSENEISITFSSIIFNYPVAPI